jgi:hypothetical protein
MGSKPCGLAKGVRAQLGQNQEWKPGGEGEGGERALTVQPPGSASHGEAHNMFFTHTRV